MKIKHTRWRATAWGALVSTLVAALPAWAVDPFTVRDIRVEGLQRVEPGTIFASLPFRAGDTYNDEQGSAAIRSLFALGLFSDVRLQVDGDVLVVIVEERPTVADVSFSGVKEFDNEVLRKALRDVGLTEGRPFDKALADRAEQELKRQYLNRSMYAAQVTTTVTPIERNRVNLNFSVVLVGSLDDASNGRKTRNAENGDDVCASFEERRSFVFARIHGLEVNEDQLVRELPLEFADERKAVSLDVRGADFKNVDIGSRQSSELEGGGVVQGVQSQLN